MIGLKGILSTLDGVDERVGFQALGHDRVGSIESY